MLLREQNQHSMALTKLKDKFIQEEESAKKMYSMSIETLKKDNEVALSKIQSSRRVQQLTQELSREKASRREELEFKLERVGQDMASVVKARWEDEWNKASAVRVEESEKQKKEELMQWRKQEIDDLIRRSILEQNSYSLSNDEATQLKLVSGHEDQITAHKESLNEQKEIIEGTKANIASMAAKKSQLMLLINEVKDDIQNIDDMLQDITSKLEREESKQNQVLAETSKSIEDRLQISRQRCDEIQKEGEHAREKMKQEEE